MEFRILGPLEVLEAGRQVRIAGSRERAFLIRLLLSPNRVVSLEALAEDLWHGGAPADASQALWMHASRLRKALRQSGGDHVLVTQAPGYLLRVDDLDAARFEELVARGREETAAGRHHQAAETLRQALELWRGPALADVVDFPFARAEAARLDEARLCALEERIEADLACGRHRQLVPELDALTRAHPLRERLWALRMLALYRSGRQAEALRAYQELRAVLGEQLGLEPSAALRQLESAILRHDPDLEGPVPAGAVTTFLFTDLVGSTEMLSRLGEDAAEELRRTHFSLLRRAVAEARGQEVKSLGDGLMVAFTSPAAAVGCAVAMQQAVAEHCATHPEEGLKVRIGLHAGEPVRAEDDFYGTAVVVAKRLCDKAEGGQVLASELVRELVGSRGGFQFRPLGRLDLKGLPDPVAAVVVEWRPATDVPAPPGEAPPIPLPDFLTDAGPIFVGREREIDRLRAAWKETVAGGRRAVLLGGEPGVGKTRLAVALAEEVYAQGAVVLAGRCDEDLGVPYQPFVEALRHFLDHTPDAHLAGRLGRFAGELARLVPELAERLPGLPPPLNSDHETERYRLFDAVAEWLASVERPVLLVLDDLQWAATPTLHLLRHVVRSSQTPRLLVVGIYRDTELEHGRPLVDLLADMRRQGGVERLPLSGLDEAGVVAFMEGAAGHGLDDEDLVLAGAIHEETEGIPFFVREVLRHLAETGAIEKWQGRWTTRLPIEELGIPEGIREVVARRLSQLSPEANQMLRLAAVIGAEFELDVVASASEADEEDLLSALEEAARARLVTEVPGLEPRYRFAHALVRDTLYGELSHPRRVILHRRVAGVIETVRSGFLDDYLPALAHHWARAGATATSKAVEYAARSGDRALAQLANDEAVAYYTSAFDLLAEVGQGASDERQLELLISLGEAQRRAGDPAHRETLLQAGELARRRDDVTALARAALGNTRGFLPARFGSVDGERVAMLEAAVTAIGHQDPRTRARLLATLGVELVFAGDSQRCLALSEEALALARSLDDPETLARVLLARYFPTCVPDLLQERLANTAELVGVVETVPDPALVAEAQILRARTAHEAGAIEEADHCFAVADRLSAGLGQPVLRFKVHYNLAGRAIAAGRFLEVQRFLDETRELGHLAGQEDAHWIFSWQLWRLRLERGCLDDEVVTLLEETRREFGVPAVDSLLALTACELGREDRARAALDHLGSTPVPFDVYWLVAMTNWAAVAAHVGDAVHADRVDAALRPYAEQVIPFSPVPTPSVTHHLGLLATTLGRYEEAERRFVEAAAIHERIGAPHWLARTRLEWARMLLARRQAGDAERSRELLGQALVTTRELGLATVERRAVAVLQDCP